MSRKNAFTLIELVIVVGIMAVLIAILIPSLSRAREQARTTKCLSNLRAMAQGVLWFAADHHGYGQAMNHYSIYPAISGIPGKRYAALHGQLTPWPLAYAPYWGKPELELEELFTLGPGGFPYPEAPDAGKQSIPLLRCPSDTLAFGIVGKFSFQNVYCELSYGINLDVFGVEQVYLTSEPNPTTTWRRPEEGGVGTRLGGRFDRVVQPSTVIMFADFASIPSANFSNVRWFSSAPHHQSYAARLAGQTRSAAVNVPLSRHSPKGALSGAFIDGHAEYIRPIAWANRIIEPGRGERAGESIRVPVRYAGDPRISPYEPGPADPTMPSYLQPQPSGSRRSR